MVLTSRDCSVVSYCAFLSCTKVEASIPTPKREVEKPFIMAIEDTFSISGRGTVATGRIEQGDLFVNVYVYVCNLCCDALCTVCICVYVRVIYVLLNRADVVWSV